MNAHHPLTAERAAHVASALGLRRTSHTWLQMARDWPKDAARYRAEAKRIRDYARWNLNKARGLDAWAEWKQQQNRKAAA